MALTDKKRRFVDALLSGLSGAKAAIQAGYSENGAAQAAARLMRDKHVLAAIGRNAEVNKRVNKKPNAEEPPAVPSRAKNFPFSKIFNQIVRVKQPRKPRQTTLLGQSIRI